MFTGTMSLFLGPEPKRCKVFLVLGLKFIIISVEPFPPPKMYLLDGLFTARIHASMHACMQASIYPSIHQFIHLSMHVSMHPSSSPSIHAAIHLSIHPSMFISIHTPIHLCIYWSVHPASQPYTCLSIHPSIHSIDIFIEHLLWGLVLWSDEQKICSSCLQGVYNLERDTD